MRSIMTTKLEGALKSSLVTSSIVCACVFGGAVCGMLLHTTLPPNYLGADSKAVVMQGVGLVATMSALVLGLLVASEKNAFDAQMAELTEMSANVIHLDRGLAYYGPETKEARELLRDSVVRALDQTWRKDRNSSPQLGPSTDSAALYDKIQQLSPKDDPRRRIQAEALSIVADVARTRLQYAQGTISISIPLLVMLVFWLTAIFMSFGLFAPPNGIVAASLFISALSVSGAILIVLEMYRPYEGLIQVSNGPLRGVLTQLGKDVDRRA
jgi:hypothetical protein